MLKIKNLTKKYKISKKQAFTALSNVNLEIKDESMVAIIGESGSGKSTLMNLISTIDIASGGYVEYDGKKVTFLKERLRATHRKENVGFIFQSFNLISDITVLENVAIVMEIAGQKKDDRIRRATELLELVGLKDHINKKPGYLSGGQKQRVAIARALANDPDLILADEPTGALDKTTSVEIMKLLSTIAASGKKVIVVTHDMKVASYCERVIKMEDGKVIEDELINQDKLPPIDLPKPLKKSRGSLGLGGAFRLSSSAFKKRIRKNIILSLGTAIAIASLLVINIIQTSIEGFFDQTYRDYGNENAIVVQAFDMEMFGGEPVSESRPDIEEVLDLDQFDDLKEYHEVPTYSMLDTGTFFVNDTTFITVNATYPNGVETFGEKSFYSGKSPENSDEIVISYDLIKELGLNSDNVIGSKVPLTYKTIDVEGEEVVEVYDFKISGVLQGGTIVSSPNTVYVSDEFLMENEDEETKIVFEGFKTFIIIAEDGKARELYEELYAKTSDYQKKGFSIIPTRSVETMSFIEIMLDATLQVFMVILGVSVFVAAIMIAVMSYVSILERMREVGVIRAIGGRKRDIVRMFIFEAIAIGFLAGIFATIIGIGFGYLIIDIASGYATEKLGIGLVLNVETLSVVIVIVGSVVLAIVASIISIMRGLKVPPVEALKMK